jgi:hypothetical protein
MIVETAIESYGFTCARCGARWAVSYEVRQASDEGVTESFYRRGGVPCAAPSGENVACPACHGNRVHLDPLYAAIPPGGLQAQGEARSGPEQQDGTEERLVPRQRAPGTWHRFKFSAVVTLDATGRSGGTARQYSSGAPGLLVRVGSCTRPSLHRYFPAVVFTDDSAPLRPGDKGVYVAVSVPDDDAAGFFQPGQHFTLWDGADIGHGTVAQRLFFSWP